MTMPCHGSTKPDAGVMVPRPATAPEIMPSTEGFPRVTHSKNIQVRAPVEAARCVATIAKAARELAPSAEPPLKPYQPTQSGADHRQRQVVGREIIAAVAIAFAEHIGRDQTGDAGIEMHDRAAGNVENAGL